MRTGNTGYSIAKHFQSQHQDWKWGTSQPFIMAPVGPTRRGNLERLVEEGVRLEDAQSKGETLVNSRGEWGRLRMKRLAVVQQGVG